MDRVPLDPEELIERGSKGFEPEDEAGGRSADDLADFRERLDSLCKAIESEANLNNLGRAFAYGQLVRAIKQRFALGALWRTQPGLLKTEIAPPIIVIGQMRSGTTRIHRLLAADPALAATRFCDSWHPVPEKPDFRPVRGALTLFMARKLDPWIDSLHPFGAARADEELGWLASALDHSAYEAQWRIPSYAAFSEARDPAPVYREFARLLRTDAAHQGNSSKPRVIKTPQFAEDLPALLAQFPDGRIIVARRNDEDTLRSSVSLVANQMVIQSNNVDLRWIEAEWQRKLALRSQRLDDGLAQSRNLVSEVHFERLGSDWETEIAHIYQSLDISLSSEALVAMRKIQKNAASSPHHGHGNDMAKFPKAS
ncbi:sulfotransferase [Pontixanthobacter gangjinensis]